MKKDFQQAVKIVDFVNDRLSHLILHGRWCDIIINVHAPTKHKDD